MPIEGGMRDKLEPGTLLVARYKGAEHHAEVFRDEEGKTRFRLEDGREFKSPSAAGSAVMDGVACNGWRWWSLQGDAPEAAPAKPVKVSKARRSKRKTRRDGRRESRRGGDEVKWGKTALSGESNTPDDAGDQITITIRPQHWFKAQDITFTGDTSAKIDTIFFGERPVWNNSSGVPVSVFSSTGMLRGLLAGQKIRPGLDIVIKGTAGTASTTTTATVIGYKPLNTSC